MKNRLKNTLSKARVQYSLSLMLGLLSLVVLVVAIQMNFADRLRKVSLPDEEFVLVSSEGGTLKGAADVGEEMIEEPEEAEEVIEEKPKVFVFSDYQKEHLTTATEELTSCLKGEIDLRDEDLRVECVRLRRKRICLRRASELEVLMECLDVYGKK
ncbi:MAG: hypothetical protein P1V18_05565 [Candidatus Gracilibacteria bacterium]|nr:hypothetical protein [Candidatus Gracilibacteria bacterium]